MNEKLKLSAVAIIGLGGTGSYILDLVAKTPVKEVHLLTGTNWGSTTPSDRQDQHLLKF